MTAGILSILGVEMHQTSELPKVASQNPKGAFENVRFCTLTSKMHKERKEGKPLRIVKKQYEEKLADAIRMHERPLWGFKSAATHHSLSIILPLMKDPHIVVVVRSLIHNAQSWQVHMRDVYGQNVSLEDALKNISDSQHILMCNSLVAKCPKLFTSYEGIKQDPYGESVRMAEFIGVDHQPKKQAILDFVMPQYSTLKSS